MRRSLLALLPPLLLAGCGGGGHGDAARSVSVKADAAVVGPEGATGVTLSQRGYDGPTYRLAVVEANGGTLTDEGGDGPENALRRTYNAPHEPGTYHVRGTVTEPDGREHAKEIAITVIPGIVP